MTRVHRALAGLPEDDQARLEVLAGWKDGPHRLTYRQAEYTFGLVARALGKNQPDGLPSRELQRICDDLLEASVPGECKDASASLAPLGRVCRLADGHRAYTAVKSRVDGV